VIIQGGLIGRLVKRFGEARLALTGALVMSAGLGGLAISSSFAAMLVTAGAIGVGNSLLMPTLSSLASRSAEAEWQGRALGVMQSCGSLARWVGPLLAGLRLSFQLSLGSGGYAFLPLAVSAVIVLVAAGTVLGVSEKS
jgi:MFS family permease